MSATFRSPAIAQRGAGIVEIMVGVLIGMLVILVVYNVFATSEQYRRTTGAAADAQVTGLLSEFTLVRDMQSAGAGITVQNKELAACNDVDLHPIPILITDGGAGNSDSVILFGGAPARVVHGVDLQATSAAGTPLVVQSPTGFDPAFCSAATPCLVIAMQGNQCDLRLGTSVIDGINPARRDITLSPAVANPYDSSGKLLNLGQNGTAMRVQYTVDDVNHVLRSQDLITNLGGNPVNPVASNIVIMKVQYGLDLSQPADGSVDCWTSAVAGSACVDPVTGRNDYSHDGVQAATAAELTRIVAVRVGLVVQSDEYAIKDVPNDITTWLFNCSLNTDADCQGRVQVTLPKYWRYRTYESVVPIRNAEWNTQ